MSKTYNTDLQTNNTNLQAILDKVNALPEASGGNSGVKTVSIDVAAPNGEFYSYISYASEKYHYVETFGSQVVDAVAGILFVGSGFTANASENCTRLEPSYLQGQTGLEYIYCFSGDSGTIEIISPEDSPFSL